MIYRAWTIVVLVALLGGCASELLVTEVDPKLPSGSTVEGVPFRLPRAFNVVIYQRQETGYEKVGEVNAVTIADPRHLYLLNFKGQTFANPSVDFEMNGDNTLQSVSIKSASTGNSAATAVGTQFNAVQTALHARDTAAASAATSSAGLSITADKAKQAADLAILQYQTLLGVPTTSAVDLLTAQQKARSAQLDANEAARQAGKPPYFPDVLP